MNIVVINGLRITTNLRYVKFTKGSSISISESKESDVFHIQYTEGALACNISHPNIVVVDPCTLIKQTNYIRILNTLVSVNGLVLKLLSPYEYQFNQFIVAGIRDFVMDYNEERCTMLIPKLKETDTISYEKLLLKNPYLELVDDTNLKVLSNIYGFEIYRQNVSIDSSNFFVFNIKDHYTRYLIADIDVVASFISQLRTILAEYGMTLHRYPIDETTSTVDRVIYKVTEYGKQDSHKSGGFPLKDEILHHTRLDFEATFLNNTMLDDFITRYQNCDLISDFTEFYTKDKRGKEWISSVEWDTITTDRNSDYNVDGQGNSGISCTFTCKLNYWVVYDRLYRSIMDIITNMQFTPIDESPNQGVDTEINIPNTEPYEPPTDQELGEVPVEGDMKDTHAIEDEVEEWIKLRQNSK